MKTIRSFVRAYFEALVLIALPFIILLFSSYWVLVNPEVIVYGLTFSFLSSFVIAHNFRQYKKSIQFKNEDLFINNLINSFSHLGYMLKEKTNESLIFEPTVHSHLLARDILVHLADNSAIIQGSRLQVRKGIALTQGENERLLPSNTMEECENELSDGNTEGLFPAFGNSIINSSEFVEAKESMTPETYVQIPEED
ncbi:hypothetical protein [Desulfosporosinus sp. SB140]|uniref:hypothetical protein n=1 Tax=Desulfosporosinus paludis TaxID=3115649 RepID=UPI00388D308D